MCQSICCRFCEALLVVHDPSPAGWVRFVFLLGRCFVYFIWCWWRVVISRTLISLVCVCVCGRGDLTHLTIDLRANHTYPGTAHIYEDEDGKGSGRWAAAHFSLAVRGRLWAWGGSSTPRPGCALVALILWMFGRVGRRLSHRRRTPYTWKSWKSCLVLSCLVLSSLGAQAERGAVRTLELPPHAATWRAVQHPLRSGEFIPAGGPVCLRFLRPARGGRTPFGWA